MRPISPRNGRILALCLLAAAIATDTSAGSLLPAMRPITAQDSVLVVAPHPDDESLCCGGLIHMAREVGARVAIVWITDGDGSRWDAMLTDHAVLPGPATYQALAHTRTGEARAAAAALGVSSDFLYFLGYPDRGVGQLMGSYFQPATPWRSPYTHASSVIYPDAFEPGAPYEGEHLAQNFRAILDRVKPTLVLAPSTHDSHPDHSGAALLATRVLRERGELGELHYWIVHGGSGWPVGGFEPQAPQTIPPRGVGLRWEELRLDAESVDSKWRAISAHQSQIRMMGREMQRYVRSTELYAPGP
jgi:LmbE family N-acetylglucosaminyl deacetylase